MLGHNDWVDVIFTKIGVGVFYGQLSALGIYAKEVIALHEGLSKKILLIFT